MRTSITGLALILAVPALAGCNQEAAPADAALTNEEVAEATNATDGNLQAEAGELSAASSMNTSTANSVESVLTDEGVSNEQLPDR